MLYIKHVGLYVNDLIKMQNFYTKCFEMRCVVNEYMDSSSMLDELLQKENAVISTVKLITQYGHKTGIGEMLELIKVRNKTYTFKDEGKSIDCIGTMHISFGVDDLGEVIEKIKEFGGTIQTTIHILSGNKCCFATDPEGNWIELIAKNAQ